MVRPEDTRKLQIVKGKDYVTLVTCTPYGVNDHRLLVRGVRTKYVKKQRSSIRPRNKGSQWMGTYKRAIAIGLAIVIALVLSGKVYQKLRRKKSEKYDKRRRDEMKRNLMNILGIILIGIGTFVFLSPVFLLISSKRKPIRK